MININNRRDIKHPHLTVLSAQQGSIKYHFLSLWYDDLGLNPGHPDHWRMAQ